MSFLNCITHTSGIAQTEVAMGRMVKRLSGLEIDEVSLVDRPANQHGLVAIAKRQEDTVPSITDAHGNVVDEEELEHGDVVYDEAGREYVFVDQEAVDGELAEDDEYEYDEVGKADPRIAVRPARGAVLRAKYREARAAASGSDRVNSVLHRAGEAGGRARHSADEFGRGYRAERKASQQQRAARLGRIDRAPGARGLGRIAGSYDPAKVGGVAAATSAAAGAGYLGGRKHTTSKSLGDQVLQDLSKAFTDEARDEVIAKALDEVDIISKRNDELEEIVYALLEDREVEDFTELAKSYELPVDPDEIGGLMQRAAATLPAEDVAALDRIFASYGEVAKFAFDEVGYNGYDESDVLSQVYAVAGEAVSKSGGTAITQEQAVTALFEANPAAYDEYEREQRRY